MLRRASRPGGGLSKEARRPTRGGREPEPGARLGGIKMRGGPGMPLV